MRERIKELQSKIATLQYRVESFGSLGDERELEGLRCELRALQRAAAHQPKISLVA